MSHEVETMFSVRQVPWHGLGTIVQDAPDAAAALALAGLDWQAEGRPVYDGQGRVIDGYQAITRDRDDQVLGILSGSYRIIQNAEAFAFADALLGYGVRFETAGSLRHGRTVWLTTKLDREFAVLDEPWTAFLTLSNTFDGSGAFKAVVSPVRVVCANTLAMAEAAAQRSFSIQHRGDPQARMDEARETLGLVEGYMDRLARSAEELAGIELRAQDWPDLVERIIPDPPQGKVGAATQDRRRMLTAALYMPDLDQWRGTAWAGVQAAAWVSTYEAGTRRNPERPMRRFLEGDPLVDRTIAVLTGHFQPDQPSPDEAEA